MCDLNLCSFKKFGDLKPYAEHLRKYHRSSAAHSAACAECPGLKLCNMCGYVYAGSAALNSHRMHCKPGSKSCSKAGNSVKNSFLPTPRSKKGHMTDSDSDYDGATIASNRRSKGRLGHEKSAFKVSDARTPQISRPTGGARVRTPVSLPGNSGTNSATASISAPSVPANQATNSRILVSTPIGFLDRDSLFGSPEHPGPGHDPAGPRTPADAQLDGFTVVQRRSQRVIARLADNDEGNNVGKARGRNNSRSAARAISSVKMTTPPTSVLRVSNTSPRQNGYENPRYPTRSMSNASANACNSLIPMVGSFSGNSTAISNFSGRPDHGSSADCVPMTEEEDAIYASNYLPSASSVDRAATDAETPPTSEVDSETGDFSEYSDLGSESLADDPDCYPNFEMAGVCTVYSIPKRLLPATTRIVVLVLSLVVEAINQGNADLALIGIRAFCCIPCLVEMDGSCKAKRVFETALTATNPLEMLIQAVPKDLRKKRWSRMGQQLPKPGIPVARVQNLVSHNACSKALRLIESSKTSSMVAVDDEVKERILALFPRKTPATSIPISFDTVGRVEVCVGDVKAALDGLPRQSSGGVSGWSYDALRALARSGGTEFVEVLAKLFQLIVDGKCPVSEHWTSSRVIPLAKKGNALDIRPICIGDSVMRVLGRLVAAKYAAKMGAALAPLQFGIGVKGGTEAIVHACSVWADIATSADLPYGVLGIDFKNAFNSVSRKAVYDGVKTFCPELIPLLRWSYGEDSKLFLSSGDYLGTCESGVRQGDPLGPLFFCLAVQKLLLQAKERFGATDFLAYMDDTTALGPVEDFPRIIQLFCSAPFKAAGLVVNKAKCWAWVPASFRLQFSEDVLGIAVKECVTVLGGFVGDDQDCTAACLARARAYGDVTKDIGGLHPQTALVLLRLCINSRPMFLARTQLPQQASVALREFDDCVDTVLLRLCRSSCNTLEGAARWVRALPFKRGGLGLRRFDDIHAAAWSASFMAGFLTMVSAVPVFAYIVNFHQDFDPMRNRLAIVKEWYPDFLVPGEEKLVCKVLAFIEEKTEKWAHRLDDVFAPDVQKEMLSLPKQRVLTTKVDDRAEADLTNFLADDQFAKAWWIGSCSSASATWQHMVIGQPSYVLTAEQFVSTLNMRLLRGSPELSFDVATVCSLCHGADGETRYDNRFHALSCPALQGMRTMRHDYVRDTVACLLRKVYGAGKVQVESPIEGTENRLDVTVTTQEGVRFIDVTLISPACTKGVGNGAHLNERGFLVEAENRKIAKYQGALQARNIAATALIPFVVSCTGTLGPRAEEFLMKLVGQANPEHADPKSELRFFRRRIQYQVAYGNARCMQCQRDHLDVVRRQRQGPLLA